MFISVWHIIKKPDSSLAVMPLNRASRASRLLSLDYDIIINSLVSNYIRAIKCFAVFCISAMVAFSASISSFWSLISTFNCIVYCIAHFGSAIVSSFSVKKGGPLLTPPSGVFFICSLFLYPSDGYHVNDILGMGISAVGNHCLVYRLLEGDIFGCKS